MIPKSMPELYNVPGEKIVDLDEKYPRLADILCDWCLLRHIIFKQEEHCKMYPTDIKLIRDMYYSFSDPYYTGFTVEKYIRYVNFCLSKIIWYDKQSPTRNIHDAIFKYGYSGMDPVWFKQLEEKIREINFKLTETFIRHYNFDTGEISFSNIPIDPYCDAVIKTAERNFDYHREDLLQTSFFKTYLTGNYNYLSIDLDSIDIKLNGRYYNKYVYSSVQEIYQKSYNFTHQQNH